MTNKVFLFKTAKKPFKDNSSLEVVETLEQAVNSKSQNAMQYYNCSVSIKVQAVLYEQAVQMKR